jgi:tripartite-type tricarboxylate transporter receptor subunit TctC
MNTKILFSLSFAVWLLSLAGVPTRSLGQDAYKGKTLRMIVGYAAGGGFDLYSRAIGRHIGRHISGNPTVIVDNMPGAGGVILANYLYSQAKPDGLTIGNFIGSMVHQQLFGTKGIEFDMRKFLWVGVPVQDVTACALTKASGITSLEKWFAAKEPVKLGGEAPGTNDSDAPRVLKVALGLPIQLIEGYKGTSQIRLAAEAGEVAGGCWTWESIKVTWRKALEAGLVSVVLQVNRERYAELAQVPNAVEYAKTDEGRQLLQLGVHDPNSILRAYALPPATPKDKVEILRKAFMETMKDSEFLAEMNKTNLAINPLSGEQVEKIIAGFFKLQAPQVARLKEVLGLQN